MRDAYGLAAPAHDLRLPANEYKMSDYNHKKAAEIAKGRGRAR